MMRKAGHEKAGSPDHEQPPAQITDAPDDRITLVFELESAEGKGRKPEYKEGRAYKLISLWTQIFIAAVTAVGVPIASYTLRDLNKNIADSHTQAVAAATQAATAQKEYVESLRPWVGVKGPIGFVDISIPYGTNPKDVKPIKFKALEVCTHVFGPSPAQVAFSGNAFFSAPVWPESRNSLPKTVDGDCKQEYWAAQGVFDGSMTRHGEPDFTLFPDGEPHCVSVPIYETADKDADQVISTMKTKGKVSISWDASITRVQFFTITKLGSVAITIPSFPKLRSLHALAPIPPISVFAGIGERSREGHELLAELSESGVLKRTALIFGQMNEPPGARWRVGMTALTVAEYFRDELQSRRAASDGQCLSLCPGCSNRPK